MPAQPENAASLLAGARERPPPQAKEDAAASEKARTGDREQPPPPLEPCDPLPSRWYRGLFWRSLRRCALWFQVNSLAPTWLHPRWHHSLFGYGVALGLVALAIILEMGAARFLPHIEEVAGVFVFLVILFVGLNWGAAPCLIATILGTLLLYYLVYPPLFTITLKNVVTMLQEGLVFFGGLYVTHVASERERQRRDAEQRTRAAEEAQRRSEAAAAALAEAQASSELERQRLQTVLDVLPVGVAIAEAQGRMLTLNHAFKELWGEEAPLPADISGYGVYKGWWPATGAPIAANEWAMIRALSSGEVCMGEEVEIETFDGQRKAVITSAAPIRDEAGTISGSVEAIIDITERKAVEQALRETNRQMNEFLGMASHELRTPLTSVLLGLQLAQRRFQKLLREETDVIPPLGQKLKFLLDHLFLTERQALRLDRLVNDLLDVARIQTGKLVMHRQMADLAAIVTEAVEEQRQVAAAREVHLHLPPDQPVPLFIDAERIRQVVMNYLTNALKYSAEDRPVEVGLEVQAGAARVWVCDQGVGLPLEEQALVWERFHRVPDIEVQSGSGVGLGLGLHISRTIIEAHQGQVGVQSAPGAGATFWFTLPLAIS